MRTLLIVLGMTESYLERDFSERLRIGSVAAHLEAYIELLQEQDYSRASAKAQLQALAGAGRRR